MGFGTFLLYFFLSSILFNLTGAIFIFGLRRLAMWRFMRKVNRGELKVLQIEDGLGAESTPGDGQWN